MQRKTRRLSGLRVALACLLVAGMAAIAFSRLQQLPPTPPVATAPTTLPGPDLRDWNTRVAIRNLANYSSREEAVGRKSLYLSCREGSTDTFSAEGGHAFRRPEDEYVEIRRNAGDSGATAFHMSGAIQAPPEPPRPGEPVPPQPTPRRARVIALEPAVLAEIEASFLGLWHDQLAPIHWEESADGSRVVLEFCWHGQYGYFVRRNPDPTKADDRRILDIANRLFALAGARLLQP